VDDSHDLVVSPPPTAPPHHTDLQSGSAGQTSVGEADVGAVGGAAGDGGGGGGGGGDCWTEAKVTGKEIHEPV